MRQFHVDVDKVWRQKIAHDLRSPISVFLGYLEFKSGQTCSDDETEYLEALRNSVTKLIDMTNALSAQNQDGILSAQSGNRRFVNSDSSVTVLIVDDDDGMRLQWRHLLAKKGLTTIEARCGEELLAMTLNYSDLQMAIVDYQYEGSDLNGLDVIEFLKRKNVARVYMCTGNFDDPQVCREARQLGAASILSKPLDLEVVEGVLG